MGEVFDLISRIEKHQNDIENISKSMEDETPLVGGEDPLNILLVVDGQKNSEIAVDCALNMAIQTHGQIILLVLNEDELNLLDETWKNEILMKVRGYGIEISTTSGYGDYVESILRISEEKGAGMVVLGLDGDGLLRKAFFGSTSERIIEESKIPVLVPR